MGFTGAIIGLAVIAIIGFMFYGMIVDGISQFRQDVQDTRVQGELDIQPTPQQSVCNLRLDVFGEIDQILFSIPTELVIKLGNTQDHTEIASWNWSCGLNPFALFDLSGKRLTELGVIAVGPDALNMKMELKAISPTGTFRSCSDHAEYCSEITINPAFVIPTPISFSETFFIGGIPQQSYDIEITVQNTKVNNKNPGNPVVCQISSSDSGQCFTSTDTVRFRERR